MTETRRQKRLRQDHYALMVHRLHAIAKAYAEMAHDKTATLHQSGLTFQAVNETLGQVMQDFLPAQSKKSQERR